MSEEEMSRGRLCIRSNVMICFAVAAWSPWMEGDREIWEKVQKRCVRMIFDKKDGSYDERLETRGLKTRGMEPDW